MNAGVITGGKRESRWNGPCIKRLLCELVSVSSDVDSLELFGFWEQTVLTRVLSSALCRSGSETLIGELVRIRPIAACDSPWTHYVSGGQLTPHTELTRPRSPASATATTPRNQAELHRWLDTGCAALLPAPPPPASSVPHHHHCSRRSPFMHIASPEMPAPEPRSFNVYL
ncbi:hypothetical protein CCHR01_10866 [Colletotrichum chrysophilum]|uniref:Uncharacterized protein n=1 Tax=Colletotrichum chrysophilum TaxID=1836956 RepID=A0AAD9EFL0_9PEZI|nr:hypothetical protein CCHR01_10866 [Colletotrichum chrysophilum]